MYLDDLKTIQNLHHATKDFYDDVCIDQGAVVRACLMNGGRAKTTVEQLYPMIKTRSIYPVTAERLLYLVTENLCEICGNVTIYPKNNSVRHVRSPYGILGCWRCVAKRQKSKRMTKRGSSFEANPFAHHAVLDHVRVAVKKIGWRFLIPGSIGAELMWAHDHNVETKGDRVADLYNYMWKNPFTDKYGNKAGPIFTYYHASILIQRMRNMSCLDQMKSEVDRFWDDELDTPSTNDPLYLSFIGCYEDSIENANVKQQQKKLCRMNDSYNYRLRKVDNAMRMLHAIHSKVNIPKQVSNKLLLDYEINVHFLVKTKRHTSYGNKIPLLMSHKWVNRELRDALKSPTKYSGKMISTLASALDTKWRDGQDWDDNHRLSSNISHNHSMAHGMYHYLDEEEYDVVQQSRIPRRWRRR